jgi:hypothetical protein
MNMVPIVNRFYGLPTPLSRSRAKSSKGDRLFKDKANTDNKYRTHMLDRRIETRMLCADLVDFHWKDTNGRKKRGVANLEDISLSGACLQVDRPVPLGSVVHISYPSGELKGVVKYSVFRDIGYFLGIEFEAGVRWSQNNYKPQHLLDPRRLMDQTIQRLDDDARAAS